MAFDREGNFNGGIRVAGWRVRDGQHHDHGCAIAFSLGVKDDDAWTIFTAFIAPDFVFMMPKIGITNNKTRSGDGMPAMSQDHF